jgi:hypothetical protein
MVSIRVIGNCRVIAAPAETIVQEAIVVAVVKRFIINTPLLIKRHENLHLILVQGDSRLQTPVKARQPGATPQPNEESVLIIG